MSFLEQFNTENVFTTKIDGYDATGLKISTTHSFVVIEGLRKNTLKVIQTPDDIELVPQSQGSRIDYEVKQALNAARVVMEHVSAQLTARYVVDTATSQQKKQGEQGKTPIIL